MELQNTITVDKQNVKEYLDVDVKWYQANLSDHAQIDCFAKIRFAISLKLITNLEAAEYCRKIGVEKAAELYEKYAAIGKEFA